MKHPGAGEGFGLEPSCPENFPGGRECFLRFLSIGNQDWDHARVVIQKLTEGGALKRAAEPTATSQILAKKR